MSTNDETETEVEETEVSQDDEQLRQDLKQSLANDTKSEAGETDKETNSETVEAESDKPEATLTTQIPSEHDLEWYKKAYEQSTTEALRLKGELDKKVEAPPITETSEDSTLTPEQLYIKQQLIKESDEAFAEIKQKYPSVIDPDTYKRFTETSKVVSKSIVEAEQRFPFAKELYAKTAVIMGLQADTSEELGAALKDGASSTRTASSPAGPAPKSKVTQEMIDLNLKMYPNKTREQIIEELEPHIN